MLLDVLLRFSIYTLSNYGRFSIPESNKRMPADLHCQILPHESSMQALSFGAFRNPPCTSRTSMHLATVFSAESGRQVHRSFPSASSFSSCTEDHQVHADAPSASKPFSCIAALLVHRRSSCAPMIIKRANALGHHRPCAQKTGPEVDASGPGSHLLAGDGAVQRWSTTGH